MRSISKILPVFLMTLCFVLFAAMALFAQNKTDSSPGPYMNVARDVVESALDDGQAYAMLRELTLGVGHRLSGSPAAAAAVEWGRQTMLRLGLDNVHLQEVMVPHWVRGSVETASVVTSPTLGTVELSICALGGSIATPELGVVGEVVEVHDLDEVGKLGKKAQGKIVFYNRPMDARLMSTFAAYSGAVDQRSRGAIEAAKSGAAAVLVRSMTTRLDDVPHTGAMRYDKNVPKIPAAAISTVDADLLSKLIRHDGHVTLNLRLSCMTLPDARSANVIGEICGSELPEEVIVLGGHLDSWDKGQGAHDDGSGCVQSMEALRLIKSLGLKPKRTIRAVLFMNEENGSRGGRAYAKAVEENGPRHIAAIESDRGGFVPIGFSVSAKTPALQKIVSWEPLFASIGADKIVEGFGGSDINPLGVKFGIPTIGLAVESHRYFDYHHSDSDTFDKVNERELELGAAAMAILAYILSMEGS
ncbi:MAG: M20/M25/M40 family metallo-hydrolase [bacterium]